ncbi:MAG: molecular chaperone DnaJ [Acidobacteriota bacterium]|nr:molecular chaperone DnaJ [Acidobacteriota bacterium]NLH68956.1 molecular chaperone DnaJ [Brooklawnia sp.]
MSARDWVEKDYYKILGVPKDAKPDQIKKAFRKIARENHPDQHPGDKSAEQRFKEASEAHDVLSDPDKRREYDEQRSLFGSGFRFPRGGGAPSGGVSGEDIFRSMGDAGIGDLLGNLFGQAGASGGRRTTTTRGPRRGSDIEGEVTIGFIQAVEGTTVGVQMTSDDACPACRGTGAKAGTMPRVCPTCQGSGMQQSTSGGVFQVTEPCRECRGRGLIVDNPCEVCHGSGRTQSRQTMQVRIPAGVTDGQKIRIKGKGSAGENGGSAGDLYVIVHVRPHPVFGRQGDNLTVTVPVTFTEAALGAEVEVPTLGGGSVKLRIPAGTPNGRTFRIRGRGVTKPNGEKGDLLAAVDVQVPGYLPDAARSALRTYAEAAREPNPRDGLLASNR